MSKAAGLDEILGKLLKDRAQILSKPIGELCNLSMTLGSFPDDACHYLKRVQKQIHQITDQYFYCLCYLNSLKKLFLIKLKNF